MSFLILITLYWLFLSAIVFVAGSLTSKLIVTAPSGADICRPDKGRRCFGERALLYIVIATFLSNIANLAHMFLHVSFITETPLKDTFSVLPIFLLKTKYGILSLLRSFLLLVLLVITFLQLKKETLGLSISTVFVSLTVLFTLSMSGHQGTKGVLSLAFLTDIVHFVAVSLWIGGLFFIKLCYSFFLKDCGEQFMQISQRLIKRFSTVATYCVFTGAVTGILLVFFRIENLSMFFTKTYGIVLSIKIMLVTLIFLLGGVNKFLLLPRLLSDAFNGKGIKRWLNVCVTSETIIGGLVLYMTSLLTHLSPH